MAEEKKAQQGYQNQNQSSDRFSQGSAGAQGRSTKVEDEDDDTMGNTDALKKNQGSTEK